MTTQEQLDYDLKIYGVSMERLKEDGNTERLDPTTVKIRKIVDDKFMPIPLVKPEDWPKERLEIIETKKP